MKKILIWISLLLTLIPSIYGQIPTGYYDAATGLSGDNLRSVLKTITKTGHVKLSYTPGVWNAYAYTDVRPAPNNTIIWDMYSDKPASSPDYTFTIFTNQCGTASVEGDCYSREHCMPNSWWGGFDDAAHPQYTDLHHLFPADQIVNSHKSNNPIGQVGTPTYTSSNGSKVGACSFPGYTGVVFEPIDEYKGDFARAYLYMATRYMDSLSAWVNNYSHPESAAVINTSGNNYKQWFIDMLIAWHNADTVSTKERNRNDAIYYNTSQHNRNPYIDHPEYVQAIWGSLKQEPTNHVTNFTANNTLPTSSAITLTWTDAIGSVIPDGYLIRASSVGFSDILSPTDSIPETNSSTQINIGSGIQTVTFTGLSTNTIYYFKIFPYTNSGTNINYKIDETIPTASDTTTIWKEDFETGNKYSYPNDTVTCTMGKWTFSNALIGTSTSDRKNGLKSARLKAANLYMSFDKADGADTITIYHAKYGNDANTTWMLQTSIDGGITWNYVGNSITTTDTILTPATFAIKQYGNIRFNIESTSNDNLINIDDITITNYAGISPPALTADTLNNNVDNNIDITFTDDTTWRSAITSVKIGDTVLTPSTDYVFSAGNLQLKPSGGNILLTTSGSKSITIEAFGYITDSIEQIINAGTPTSNSTATINSALALNSSRIITCTAKDQYNNLVAGYTFKYDEIITNNDATTTESYTIDEIARTTNANNVNVTTTTNASGVTNFTVALPATVDINDGISIQVKLSDGITNIDSAFSYTQLASQITLTGIDPASSSFEQNSSNNVLYRIKIDIANNPTILNGLTAITGGNYIASDITSNGLKLWYSADTSFGSDINIASLSSISTGSGETLSFTGLSQSFAVGTAYLFITADIATSAVIGNTISCSSSTNSNFTFSNSPTYTGSLFTAANLHSITTNSGPTTLQAGDIAIVAYQYDDPDIFAFVFLRDVNAATTITFTDNAWDGSALKTTEGSATWTAPSGGLTKGTLIKIQGTTVTGGGSVSTNNMAFSTSGDQIIAYQGSSSSPTFITALTTTSFITSGSTTSNTTYLPTSLKDKVTANSFSTEADNGYYSCQTSGTINFLRAAINNSANWITNNSIQTLPSWSFSISSSTIINQNTTAYNLTIGTDETMTVNSGITLTADTLTIQSNATGTGSFVDNGTCSIGTSIVERYIIKDDSWHFLSSPVAAQTIQPAFVPLAIDNTFDFYKWDETVNMTTGYPWINIRNISNTLNLLFETTFEVGRGYLVAYNSSYGSSATHYFTGTLNTGDKPISISFADNHFNLIGNPYPSAIDWDESSLATNAATRLNTNPPIWIWNDAIGNYGCYLSGTGGTNNVTNIIAPHQGFFVEAKSGGNFTMPNTARTHPYSQSYLKSSTANLLKLKVSSTANTYSDEMIIQFSSTNNNNGVVKWFSMIAEAPSLYSVKNNQNYSINILADSSIPITIPVAFKAGVSGNHTIFASEISNFTLCSSIVLEDLHTNTVQNLMNNPTYNFTANIIDNINRFLLHFNSAPPNNIIENPSNNANIYAYNKNIYINTSEKIEEISVYNILGQQIIKQTGNDNIMNKISVDNTFSYYIVKVVTSKNTYTKKVFIE